LKQDDVGGLEVEFRETGEWIQAPPIDGTFVVNIGDMLERWTCGKYKATPHRVKNVTTSDRLSAPFFFDPNFECIVTPLSEFAATEEEKNKWEPIKYGDYILAKVFAVFPELRADALK
jgi:isopenicillin N synthase-like dioxygenase